ncbi:MAG: hypothetical protein NC453_28190, partial [Muribaculum sp.]|nr:hypothetical protein [Muribaculum sp.]
MKIRIFVVALMLLCKLQSFAQFYDPSIDMINQMFNQMNSTLDKTFREAANNLIEMERQEKENRDKTSQASISYMFDGSSFSAYLTYVGGSAARIVYVSPRGSERTLVQNQDYTYASGLLYVNCKLDTGSSLKVYNGGTNRLLASKSIPDIRSSTYESFCTESINNCGKFVQLLNAGNQMLIGNDGSGDTRTGSIVGEKTCS